MAIDFINPEFIEGNDADSIHARMMAMLPADMDNTPGGFPWDFTRPTALMKSELVQFYLSRTLMLMFPMWAWGSWLDLHASEAAISRKEAGYARGRLVILGIAGTIIPAGSGFATAAADTPSISFLTTEECEIGEDGKAEAAIIAAEPGTAANVAARTIVLMMKTIMGIISVYNQDAITGGSEEEDDEALRQRIQEANVTKSASFVGNDADYIRWAKEIIGVGGATVIPEWDGPGTVKLIIVDSNGEPANEYILADVYNHIISPENRMRRIAPIGAQLTVAAPEVIDIHYECQVSLKYGYEEEVVIEAFKEGLLSYYEEAKREGVLKFTRVCAVLSATEGVSDFSHLKMNGADHANISLEQYDYPRTAAVVFESLEG